MKDFERGLTADRVRELLRYSPSTGEFHWRVMNSCRRPAGMLAGDKKKDSGYILIGVDCFRYRAHRLAWLYMTGKWPAHQVDHKDRDRSNNKWANLREATQQQNSANMQRPSVTGVKGVIRSKNGKRWIANIAVNGRTLYLGTFDTSQEASAAYTAAAREHFGEFAWAA